MMENGVFMVHFNSIDDRKRGMDAGPILYDRKPVIVKCWSVDFDILAENVKLVPSWIKL